MLKPYLSSFSKLIVLFIFSCLLSTPLKAVNLVGADIYYEYLSPLNYKVHLIKYRDCSGPALVNTIDSITVTSVSNSYSAKFSVDTALANHAWNGTYRSNWSPSIPTTCMNPQSLHPGWQYFHFQGDVSLPYGATDWVFTWQGDSRGPNISNVVDSTICLRAGLNNTTRPNGSIVFTEEPMPNFIINQPWQYLNSPADPELDSIVFSNETPSSTSLNNPNACIAAQYIAPYTLANPIASTSPFQLSSVTGIASFTPNLTGKYILKFRATDYDPVTSDVVGFVEREGQLTVLNKTAPLAVNEKEKQNTSIILYPNPVTNNLNVKLIGKNTNEPMSVNIYNSFGQKVLSKNIRTSVPMAISSLPVGFYYTEVKVGAQTYRASFLKK